MEFLVIMLIMGGIGAVIGQKKGQPVGGFFLGVLLGPIGWIIAYMAKAGTRTCPDCAERVIDKAKVCKHCGHRFAGVADV